VRKILFQFSPPVEPGSPEGNERLWEKYSLGSPSFLVSKEKSVQLYTSTKCTWGPYINKSKTYKKS
jgi:hypothetical protein